MIAVYLGEPSEEKILRMSQLFFEDVIRELGYRLNYEAIVNYAGNSFFEKSWDVIMENNPFSVGSDIKKKKSVDGMAGLFANANIRVVEASSPVDEKEKSVIDTLNYVKDYRKRKENGTNE